jgi:hypothetical protein
MATLRCLIMLLVMLSSRRIAWAPRKVQVRPTWFHPQRGRRKVPSVPRAVKEVLPSPVPMLLPIPIRTRKSSVVRASELREETNPRLFVTTIISWDTSCVNACSRRYVLLLISQSFMYRV